MRGKRNRFKIVSSQKARAGRPRGKTRAEGNNSSIETLPRSWTEKHTTRWYSLFGPAWYHGYYELNEKEVNSVAAKMVDSSGYFQLET